jgi:fimbrial isopeptide formation D2 family protein
MKTTIISRTMRGTLAIAMALTTASTLMSVKPALAADDKMPNEVNVVLHKKDATGFDGTWRNTGGIMEEFAGMKGIPGAQFTAYDITQYYYSNLTKDNEDTLADEMTKNIASVVKEKNLTPIEIGKTDTNGNVTKSLKTYSTYTYEGDDGNDVNQTVPAVYAILETESPEGFVGGIPMIVGMANKYIHDGDEGKEINLYPKNYGMDKVLVGVNGEELENELTESAPTKSFDVGDVLTYKVTYTIPNDIADTLVDGKPLYTKFTLSDVMSEAGADYTKISKIIVADKDIGTELLTNKFGTFESGHNPANWSMAFNMNSTTVLAELKEHAGKQMDVYYEVTLNEKLEYDHEVDNDFTVDMTRDGEPISETQKGPDITTRAHEILKVDSKSDTELGGAVFYLYRDSAAGREYAEFVDGDEDQPWVNAKDIVWGDRSNATELVTKDKEEGAEDDENIGLLTITGLADGTYTLEEIKAPANYALPDDPHFTIVVSESKDSTKINLTKIKNVRENPGSLPLTGGIGVITLLVIGGGMMGLSKMKKKEED